uniref:Uncharacterized protein n=1 Tax=Amphora coffeiformis TaxID=265554 RepID=A0A7S3LDT9_9STRA
MLFQILGIVLALSQVVNAGKEYYEDPLLLVGNTRADNIVAYYADGSLMEFVGGLNNPDHIRIYGDYLYVTVGDTPETSTMYRQNLKTGKVDADFLKGGDLLRPYGFDFYKGRIYVASFLTDKIIVYDMETGGFIGVFAEGDGTEEGLVNGPNHIAIYDDMLYLTTQGSVATDGEPIYGLSSQISVFDLHTGEGEVFAPQPEPLDDSLGFVSMLGIQIYCTGTCDPVCYAYTTDFAGGLRAYSLDGELVYATSTTYESGAIAGALSIVDDVIYVPGFVDDTTDGVVQRFSVTDGSPLPAKGITEAGIFVPPSKELVRPIGILAYPSYKKGSSSSTSSKNCGKGYSTPSKGYSISSKGKGFRMKMMMMSSGKGKGY